jgi:hypothetical protein
VILRSGLDAMLRKMEALQMPRNLSALTPVATWQNQDFPCSVSTEARGESIELGGHMVEVELTIIIRTSAMDPRFDVSDDTPIILTGGAGDDTIPPAPNHSIKLKTRSRTYRIVRVRFNAAESHWSLDCVDPYRP